MTARLGAALTLAALCLLAWPAAPAAAHAELLRSEPSPHAVLEHPPAELRLWFSEQVEVEFNPVTLIDGAGRTVPGVQAALAPDDVTQVRGRLPALATGHYVLRWRVLSADGHPIQGSIPFQVGLNAGPPPDFNKLVQASAAGRDRLAGDWLWPLARGVSIASALLLAGSLLLIPLVWYRSAADPAGSAALTALEAGVSRRIAPILAAAAVVLLAGNALQLGLQGAALADVDLLRGFRPDVLGTVAMRTRFGLIVVTRMGLVAIGLGAAWLLDLRERWAGAALGVALLLTHSLGGHAVAQPGALPVLADWLHLLAVAPWVAGLALAAFVVFPALRGQSAATRRAALALLGPRFSRVGLASVAAIAATGLYGAWLYVPGVAALPGTAYGRALSVKLACFALLVGLGAVNFGLTRRHLQAKLEQASRAAAWLRRSVAAEVALVVVVLAATAVLIGLPPARQALGAALPVVATRRAGDMQVSARLEPNRPGLNSFEVTITGPDGKPVEEGLKVRTFGYMPDHRHMTQETDMPALGGGRYRLDNVVLMGGRWQLHVVMQRGGEEHHVLIDFNTPES